MWASDLLDYSAVVRQRSLKYCASRETCGMAGAMRPWCRLIVSAPNLNDFIHLPFIIIKSTLNEISSTTLISAID